MVASLIYEVDQRQVQRILAAALFLNVKETFNHLSKTQIVAPMLELKINRNLIQQTKSFIIKRKLQPVIDSYKNPKKMQKQKLLNDCLYLL